ncbi:MAG TPA: helix-turn-helix domain-containing protein [Actinomycetota bacterium]|nr:helix-turn-helix domain-containing protein [Actinomycetota bacterium]
MELLLLQEAVAQPETYSAADVVIIRWPEEAASLQRLRTLGRPRLLLVAPDAPAPATVDCTEDWIRLPAEDADVRARIATLAARAGRHGSALEVKGDGRLTFRGRWVNVSGVEEALAGVLSAHFGELVDDQTVEAAASADGLLTSNALHVNVSRLRKRLAPLGLVIRRVRNRGYVMEAV